MINSNINNGGIYKAFILHTESDTKIYIPGLYNNTKECPIQNGTLNIELFQKNKDLYPNPLWCVPNIEAKQCEEVHPCWVVFENGDISRPIIMGFLGKGIKYSAGTILDESNNSSGDNIDNPSPPDTSKGYYTYPIHPDNNYNNGEPGYRFGVLSTHKAGYHPGQDFPVPEGTKIVAINSGTVVEATNSTGAYGKYIIIEHSSPDKIWSLYAHNSELQVSVGDIVKTGDVIALSGNTGNTSGPHLHLEIRVENVYKGGSGPGAIDSSFRDPMNYIPNPFL